MPKIQMQMTDSEGWKPLPKGTYTFIIDSCVETLSSKNNRQLKYALRVQNHPQYADKKCTMFTPMTPSNAAWRTEEVLTAVGVEYDVVEHTKGQEPQDDLGNKIAKDLNFDTDDLVGGLFVADVDVEDYNGREQQRFNKPRPVEATPRPAGASAAPVQQSQGHGAPAAGQVATPVAAGGEQQRRRRVVQ